MRVIYAGWALLLVIILGVPSWHAAEAQGDGGWHKLSGEYSFFSGEVGEMGLPTNKDAKLALHLSGPVAARMFTYMGSRAGINSCNSDEETRVKSDLVCTRSRTNGKAECSVGLDMHSGKTVGATDC